MQALIIKSQGHIKWIGKTERVTRLVQVRWPAHLIWTKSGSKGWGCSRLKPLMLQTTPTYWGTILVALSVVFVWPFIARKTPTSHTLQAKSIKPICRSASFESKKTR